MADIFISYSSKDREKAEQLTELLVSAGLSVWIDKQGIGAATSWSGEITRAISDCKALVVMLSSFSIESKNVVREVSLAFEKNKKILPLDIEPVTLTDDLAYHLAGLQRTSMTNIDAIIRALGKLGFEATQAPTMKLVKETDGRRSLMILPFEDLSPTADNQWFADGIVSEMISLLSNVKALKLTDAQTTKEFKNFKGHLAVYAREMGIRYFVQGDVRKFGDAIKITSRLLDIETGDHLWQDSLKGTMDDIFDIQEQVAQKVLEAMKIHLVQSELDKLGERGTENAEAYELLMKAKQYVGSNTRQDFEESIRLCNEALALDPNYAEAYSNRAAVLAQLFRVYNPDPKLLDEAIEYAKRAVSLKPTLWGVHGTFSHIFMLQGKIDDAVKAAEEYIRNSPNDFSAHFALGFLYDNTANQAKAIPPYAEAHRIKPDDVNVIMNLVNCYLAVGDTEKTIRLAEHGLPLAEKRLKLFPKEEFGRVSHVVLLNLAGKVEEAKLAARGLDDLKDGFSLYNTACIQRNLGDFQPSLLTFKKAIEAGFLYVRYLKNFLILTDEERKQFSDNPEYKELLAIVDAIETKAKV